MAVEPLAGWTPVRDRHRVAQMGVGPARRPLERPPVPGERARAAHARHAVVAEDETEGANLVDAGKQPAHVRMTGVATRNAHDVVDAEGRVRGAARARRQDEEGRRREGAHYRISIIIGRRRRKAYSAAGRCGPRRTPPARHVWLETRAPATPGRTATVIALPIRLPHGIVERAASAA